MISALLPWGIPCRVEAMDDTMVVIPPLGLLRPLEAYGAVGATGRYGPPTRTGAADAALLAHVACELRTAHRVHLLPTAAEVPDGVCHAVRELRAIAALLQE